MKYNKNDLEKMILVDKLSYRKIGKIFGISDTYVKKIARNFGIILPQRAIFSNNYTPHNKGNFRKSICKNCGKIISLTMWNKRQYCNKKCFGEFKSKNTYEHYLNHQEEYCTNKKISFIKKFLLIEQNNKCAICENKNNWNNKSLIFILDHIDGNAYNNYKYNLRLICPNCDSQLDTYKSKNKNSARKERYLLNYKNM
jgi:hypothetical protein